MHAVIEHSLSCYATNLLIAAESVQDQKYWVYETGGFCGENKFDDYQHNAYFRSLKGLIYIITTHNHVNIRNRVSDGRALDRSTFT